MKKRMNKPAILFLSLVLAFGMIGFIGCGGGGSDSSTGSSSVSSSVSSESAVVGTWDQTAYSGEDTGPTWITFNSDGTYTDRGGSSGTYSVSGTSISGSHTNSDGTMTWNGTISGTTMEMTFSSTDGNSGTVTLSKR